MALPRCELQLLLLLILFSCLKFYKCEDVVQSCCPSNHILGLGRDKSVRCVNSTNITSLYIKYQIGPKQTNYSSWEKCNYELQPITRMNDKKNLFCVNELFFFNEKQKYQMPYLAGIRCKNDTIQNNRLIHGVNKCCKMGEMFSNNCTPLKSGKTNVIDQEINQGRMYAAVDLYSFFFSNKFSWGWPLTFKVYEKPISYFTNQEYIKDFSNGHPMEYCIEQSENASKVIVMTQTKCSNCVPQCHGFDTYMAAKPNSKEKFKIRSTTWNQNDSYDYMNKFKLLFLKKTIFGRNIKDSVCLKGIKKYERYTRKFRGFSVTYEAYSHNYDTDICSGIIYDESFKGNEESFSCKHSFENWTTFKQIILVLGFVCTILTFLVYAYLSSLRNVFGKSLMVYLVCCMGLNVLYYAIHFEVNVIKYWYYRGFVKYFFDISKSFWMLLMSYDVWTTMRKINVQNRLASAGYRRRTFLGYCFMSFTPSIILTIYLILDEYKNFESNESREIKNVQNLIKQHNENMDDDFKRNNDKFLNFYVIPTLCFVIINLVFYAHTLMHIHRIKRQAKALRILSDNQCCFKYHRKFQYQFGLIVKLFCAMGLVWMFNVPALIISYTRIDLISKNTDLLHVLSEISSFLEGIFIFFIFVVKKRIFQQLHERLKAQLLSVSLLKWTLQFRSLF